LTGVGAIVLFVVACVRAQDRHEALKYTGVGIMITAVLSFLLFAPAVQAVAQNNIANPTMQIVVGQVVSALMRRFAIQSLLLVFIGLIVIVVNHAQAKQAEPTPASLDKAEPVEPAPATPAPRHPG
jgi:nicotinamide riboside transporter PnuC